MYLSHILILPAGKGDNPFFPSSTGSRCFVLHNLKAVFFTLYINERGVFSFGSFYSIALIIIPLNCAAHNFICIGVSRRGVILAFMLALAGFCTFSIPLALLQSGRVLRCFIFSIFLQRRSGDFRLFTIKVI
ncbi:hypothetical protein V8F20_010766 [Naviculisporaceae sp. PSN 640]